MTEPTPTAVLDPDLDAVLTVSELARLLKVSRPTIMNMITAGTLDAFKVGKAWRIPVDQIKGHLDGTDSRHLDTGQTGKR